MVEGTYVRSGFAGAVCLIVSHLSYWFNMQQQEFGEGRFVSEAVNANL